VAETCVPDGVGRSQEQLAQIGEGLTGLVEERREISHGLHPAVLSAGCLRPAIKALARRSMLPVALAIGVGRRAAGVGSGSRLERGGRIVDQCGQARAGHRSYGVGGATSGKRSGLTGLKDRVEALGGQLTVISPMGEGASLSATVLLHQLRWHQLCLWRWCLM
jgi:signal transduction histidine kinase